MSEAGEKYLPPLPAHFLSTAQHREHPKCLSSFHLPQQHLKLGMVIPVLHVRKLTRRYLETHWKLYLW